MNPTIIPTTPLLPHHLAEINSPTRDWPILPYPGQVHEGQIVIASVWQNDDATGGENQDLYLAGLLLLNPRIPRLMEGESFYSVVQLVAPAGSREWTETVVMEYEPTNEWDNIRNITDAVAHYDAWGGNG